MHLVECCGERESLAIILSANGLAEVYELGFVGRLSHFLLDDRFYSRVVNSNIVPCQNASTQFFVAFAVVESRRALFARARGASEAALFEAASLLWLRPCFYSPPRAHEKIQKVP